YRLPVAMQRNGTWPWFLTRRESPPACTLATNSRHWRDPRSGCQTHVTTARATGAFRRTNSGAAGDSDMAETLASLRHEGEIAIVTLDDGKVNVFSLAMAARLAECFAAIPKEAGAVVVTGRPGIFSAGFDLKTIRGGDPRATAEMVAATVR